MKRIPTSLHPEQSKNNTATVPAVACKNSLLMEYLDSAKFEKDFQDPIKEKAK